MVTLTSAELSAIAVRVVTGTIGTFGFAVLFKVSPKRLPFVMLGGMITWIVYEAVSLFSPQIVVASFISALVMALYSELMARVVHAPTILFLLTGAVPIVPGNGLYQSIRSLLTGDMARFETYAKSTLETLLGITVGLGVSSIIVGVILQLIKTLKTRLRHK